MSPSQAFASIANTFFPTEARVLPSSWCPDKDLLALITNIAGKDRLSLWKMQGSKIWEVDVHPDATEGSTESRIVDISWSPDNLHIAVAHHPPLVTLHSIQDGREERKLSIPRIVSESPPKLTHVWWYKEHRQDSKPGIPDIFKRQNIITGSAHSILKTQPLLDALPDESDRLSSADLFAFSRTRTAVAASDSLPASISSWPTLPPEPLLASIQPRASASKNNKRPGEELDEVDDSNVNSILFVIVVLPSALGALSPPSCQLHAWLDGSYPLGVMPLPCAIASLHKLDNATYLGHAALAPATALHPSLITLPALLTPAPRRVAQTASSTRALVWYTLRVVKELRDAWFGTSASPGARAVGQAWVHGLEQRQRTQFGVEEPNALLDLTALLATGRTSESVSDYLGSGEQMSERGLQKWENTVVDALFKFRDYAQRRVVPAFQRIHILLQEVQGWAQLPQYRHCRMSLEEVNIALDLAARGIICATWLASTARLELRRFREFMAWVKYESSRATNLHNDTYTPPPPKHDVLDVAAYLERGLVASAVDRWFVGPVPRFALTPGFGVTLRDLPVRPDPVLGFPVPESVKEEKSGEVRDAPLDENAGKKACLSDALRKAREKLAEGRNGLAWPPDTLPPDLSSLDRNLDALTTDLAQRCSAIFQDASGAVLRDAGLAPAPHAKEQTDAAHRPQWFRERTRRVGGEGTSRLQQLWAAYVPATDTDVGYLCLFKTAYAAKFTPTVACAVMACEIDGGGAPAPVELLDAAYFDDDHMVAAFRADGAATLALVSLDVEMREVDARAVVTREGLVDRVVLRVRKGEMPAPPLKVEQSRTLAGCAEGVVALSVNGRAGRRVACVLGEGGTTLQVFDMEGEEDEEDEEEEE
ncbi:anaphase-promoting complex subunit 4 [Phanerochaete sordida]|uniref:Anaphase-promoting complex subunit 4 n=1 Tax=Phanerochaete sordida TaxID=48140 RepID=A0A9P3GXH5_9APHY|nr:anaphase-promoting complex subunit 4 [Phanerochaete sordida]